MASTRQTDEANVNHGNGSNVNEEEDLDVEMALLAMTEDVGGPREELDLSTLSAEEKRTLLQYLRERLGVAPAGGDCDPRAGLG